MKINNLKTFTYSILLIMILGSSVTFAGGTGTDTRPFTKQNYPFDQIRTLVGIADGSNNYGGSPEGYGVYRVKNNPIIKRGNSGGAIKSARSKYELRLQADGNLCKYRIVNGQAQFVWCNMKYNYGQNSETHLSINSSGSLVIFNGTGFDWSKLIWASNFSNKNINDQDMLLVFYEDGELYLINKDNQVLWSQLSK